MATAAHRRYVGTLGVLAVVTLAPIVALNLQLLSQSLGLSRLTLEASEWQQQTEGVVNVSGGVDGHRLFKSLRLNDRLPAVDTVILGSSTVMGLSATAMPTQFRAFNFATSSNALSTAIGEADFLQASAPGVRWLVIPLDWVLGFLYWDDLPAPADLSAAAATKSIQSATGVPWLDRARDALSYPRVTRLFTTLRAVVADGDPVQAFSDAFLSPTGPQYRCEDGSLARDFDVVHRGRCHGFRFDGSATFAGLGRVGSASPDAIRSAVSPDGPFMKALRLTSGEPNAVLLDRLVMIAGRARQAGGGLILLRPPLLPGVEAAARQATVSADALARTRARLDVWAERHRLTLIDAGESERFGCTADEFVDAHHAVESCYRKVFAAWPAAPR